jgi:hypothetical protein
MALRLVERGTAFQWDSPGLWTKAHRRALWILGGVRRRVTMTRHLLWTPDALHAVR